MASPGVKPDHKVAVQNDFLVEGGDVESGVQNPLKRGLQSRHMQMIAIGGAIGAGLFVGSGKALATGGPASLIICYAIVGVMLLFTCQALAELAVLYPVNGAFFTYTVRFVDPSWGFATGWDYVLTWLTVLPFELVAAGITIEFWRTDINMSVWITLFLVVLVGIQFFGVRGYGEVEFILSIIKITACVAFIILGVVIDCGGTGDQGYIGAKYWKDPGAFRNGFKGFAGVFVVAAFSFGGTELVGLAAAESENPRKSIPKASKQVFWRIAFFYIVNLFIVGLIVPYDNGRLISGTSGIDAKASPFVIAIEAAGIKVLPHIINGVITIAVISVANSATFASSRTMQALAAQGMGPKFLAYVDKSGRPLWSIVVQLAMGLVAYVAVAGKEQALAAFTWLLALGGASYFFVWATVCLTHIRFRYVWKAQGNSLDDIPYKPALGILGSYIGLALNTLALLATMYTSAYDGENLSAKTWFETCLAVVVVAVLYIGHKIFTKDWRLYIPANEVDLSGARILLKLEDEEETPPKTWRNLPRRIMGALF
ncbi:amino acid permease/ SLC12A domain-containing protein [Podospora didyma]|uniref:Amino acid permease/ SLC12A domain-containing protein n=1 Tax=Podospora didyma TaxID=330526 RepID=A0AAE0KF48_9PEZI|nr:amino acid permease/ SLC12A domain-containing protein [Podospora didyma]